MLPEYVSAHSNKYAYWQCKEEKHEWKAQINSRSKGSGCPYCAGQLAIVGVNDLATVRPDLAAEWHPTKNGDLKPKDVMVSSNIKVWWQCERGHEWQTMIYHRSQKNCNCPVCSGKQVLAGYNDLATVNPLLAAQWDFESNGDLKPTDFTCGSDKKVGWICEKKHKWEATISSRHSGGCGCPYCAGQKVLTGVNDLATVNPQLASEWHPIKNGKLTPRNVRPGSNQKVWWLGECGHSWEASIQSRNSGRGCPYCANQKLLVGFNDLATKNPRLASEWHPTKNGDLTPYDVMSGSNQRVWWICDKGHEWENTVSIRNSGHGCPYCCNQMVLKGYNDLATLNPKLASEWHPTLNGDLTPYDVMPGSNKKAWWQCENGHEWLAQIKSRNSGCGCQTCYHLRKKQNNNQVLQTSPKTVWFQSFFV